jgi:hypothetical protein
MLVLRPDVERRFIRGHDVGLDLLGCQLVATVEKSFLATAAFLLLPEEEWTRVSRTRWWCG